MSTCVHNRTRFGRCALHPRAGRSRPYGGGREARITWISLRCKAVQLYSFIATSLNGHKHELKMLPYITRTRNELVLRGGAVEFVRPARETASNGNSLRPKCFIWETHIRNSRNSRTSDNFWRPGHTNCSKTWSANSNILDRSS